MRALAGIVAVLLLGGGSALADGGPSPGVLQGGQGIERGNVRYVAVPSGARTVVEVIRRSDGRVLNYMSLKGVWGIPLVTFSGTTDGLSKDGRLLVLGDFPNGGGLRSQSRFALIDAKRMRLLRTIRVKGDMSFDALAPTGRYFFLIEHVSQQDFTRYRVRAYDLLTKKLLARVIVDKREWEPTMQGSPVSRAVSQSGDWVYTLYAGAKESFIHALDARDAGAVCIDLPWKNLPGRVYDFRLRLRADGKLVVFGPHGRTLAVVDPSTYRVLSSVSNP
jgi:hypothetical protein